ncbi:F-box/kelch-repeat protein At3g23880-like isoform X1 [Daucus carota subsp. sativus]|uniref:F-box/kelch-repeat protein At3g23880-like isoform X1 n=2 Tax=Daucus carota subsp. sativus TaxID=79200 RepID=UPI0007EFA1DF|nr:PREDICTED: F-box/kelch-repeat protein At3g23880-like isoform X1 [Daucus carota subsp. sativus]XP_017252386.1 PREDICTED: F-box/kelch-repeat protein At3g23880-like isoform X1 [Daucus carota subsp. sativus]
MYFYFSFQPSCIKTMTRDLQLSVKELQLSVREATSIFELPEELLIEILSRLPARSLLSCRRVCQRFNIVTRSPNLIATHVKRASTLNTTKFCSAFIFGSNWIGGGYEHILLKNTNDSVTFSYVRPSNPLSCNISIVGCCNGLFCAEVESPCDENGGHFLIWNPITRENRYVLKPNVNSSRNPYIIALAFGYSHNTNDYKVVRIVSYPNQGKSSVTVEVYKMTTEDWSVYDVTTLPCSEPDQVPSQFNDPLILFGISSPYFIRPLKQAFHWITDSAGIEDRLSKAVVSFDIEEEQLNFFSWLDPFKIPLEEPVIIDTLNDSLSLLVPHLSFLNSSFDIWVMDDYGKQASWTRRFTVEQFDGLARPVGYWTDDLLIMTTYERNLFFYNLKTQELKISPFLRCLTTFCDYVETLETVSREIADAGRAVQ